MVNAKPTWLQDKDGQYIIIPRTLVDMIQNTQGISLTNILNDKADIDYVDSKSIGFTFEDESMYIHSAIKNSSSHNYDNTEKIVGTWFGEPIYEKSMEFTIDKHYSGEHVWTDSIPNFDTMIDIKGTMKISSGKFFNLPHVSINNNYGVAMLANDDGSITLDTGSGDRTNSVVRVTIQYTKKSD